MPDSRPYLDVERVSEFGSKAERWNNELSSAEAVFNDWKRLSKEIGDRYELDSDDDLYTSNSHRFNILWSNVETLLPAIYSREPTPVVKRRFRDSDAIARLASEMLERAIMNEMESDERMHRPLDHVLTYATVENLLYGRGNAWIRYEPQISEGNEVIAESCPVDFVCNEDFLHCPKKTWAEVVATGWVARRVDMTREEGEARFGERFAEVPLSDRMSMHQDEGRHEQKVVQTATVWEIWDAESKSVIWLNRDDVGTILDEKLDPLRLDGFFPCPRPIYSTLSKNSLIPIPDYKQYRQLAMELDRQSERIDNLSRQLRVAGIYDSSMEGMKTLLDDNQGKDVLIPVANYAAIASKSGGGQALTGVVQYLPIDVIAKALIALYDARERTKTVLYEVSGIADVLRGVVDPREKLGQSQLKSRNASMRIDKRRQLVEQFARDLIRMKAEIISEHYDPTYIRVISAFDEMPQVKYIIETQGGHEVAEQAFNAAVTLIKNERLRGFRVDVETNSTVMLNDEEEKSRRIEFLTAAGGFIEQAMPAATEAPELGPLLGQMLLFGVRGFRAGRQLEGAFEDTINKMAAAIQSGEGQQDEGESAEAQKAQIEIEGKQMEAQAKQQEIQLGAQVKQQEAESKSSLMQQKHDLEMQKLQAEMQKMQADTEIEREKLVMDLQKMEAERDALREQALLKAAEPTPGAEGRSAQ